MGIKSVVNVFHFYFSNGSEEITLKSYRAEGIVERQEHLKLIFQGV
jgi:hypothetical protein